MMIIIGTTKDLSFRPGIKLLSLVFLLAMVTILIAPVTCRAEPKPEVVADASDGLNNPFGITFDSGNNAYIVEYLGGRIFILKPGGKPQIFAGKAEKGFAGDGGPANKALFNGMHNAVCTSTNQLYISDTRSNRIRKIDLETGLICTIAGNGEPGFSGDGGPALLAQLNDPISIALNHQSNLLLIADIRNRRIRAIDLKTGIIKTLAGSGKKGVPEDGGTATQSPLFDPRACAIDSKGNLYILERGGHALRVVGTDGPARLAHSDSRNQKQIFRKDASPSQIFNVGNTIRTVAGTGKKGSSDGPALQAGLNGPKHLCFDDKDRVIIADAENHLIRIYDPKKQSLTTLLGRETKLNRPHGVTFHEGWLYIADSWNNRVLRIKL